MSILAFVIVLFAGPFVLTIGVLLVGMLINLLLIFLPMRIRVPLGTFVGGVAGTLAMCAFSYWIFGLVASVPTTSWLPLIATAVGLVIPYLNDSRKAKQLHAAATQLPDALGDYKSTGQTALPFQVVGYLIGIAICVGWFLLR